MTADDGYSHLLPLVQALVDAGNEILPGRHAAAFQYDQGGAYCAMSGPLRFDAVRDLPRRPEVHFDEARDFITCRHCWAIIYGGRYNAAIYGDRHNAAG
jgi:hypothetical protein